MADETAVETESHLEQQQDPNGDLMKARPGGDTDPIEPNPNGGFSDLKPESEFEGTGSKGGYEGGPGKD